MSATVATARFPALGTTATVLVAGAVDDDTVERARRAVSDVVSAVDASCSRFRDDSELAVLNTSGGEWVPVSPWLLDAVTVARRAAELTGGLVDPTIATALRDAGYDRDFRSVPPTGPALDLRLQAVPGWWSVDIDPAGAVRLPRGVELDLGATAKALAADRAAAAASEQVEGGVLVSLGGDISVAGTAPEGGWDVRVTDDHADGPDAPGATVAIDSGGLATSGTTVRRWVRGDVVHHHIVDPRTGQPARPSWRTVSVAAGTCVDANIASTASVVLGDDAPAWLEDRSLPARLVRPDGRVRTVGGWPTEVSP